MGKNIFLLETQKDIDLMLKNDFLNKLTLLTNSGNLRSKEVILILKKIFTCFKEDYIYNVDESIGIDIKNGNNNLLIDLWPDSINIRYNNSEFYFFLEEISLEDFNRILENFFKGKYTLKTYIKENLIIKQELLFDDIDLTKYNQEDVYSKKKYTNIIEKVGCNWFK
jgi:hypothetical protein